MLLSAVVVGAGEVLDTEVAAEEVFAEDVFAEDVFAKDVFAEDCLPEVIEECDTVLVLLAGIVWVVVRHVVWPFGFVEVHTSVVIEAVELAGFVGLAGIVV